MKVLDLFSGVGGFPLGLERTGGFRTIAFCEIDPLCRRVLAKHWPEVPCYDDIRTLTARRLRADGIAPDVLCGGFPCQDISDAGPRLGLDGERSGLWSEFARLIGELRPCYAIVENAAALRWRGLARILGDLAALGYDAEWHCIPASAVGAPHVRDRLWIVAHPAGWGPQGWAWCGDEGSWRSPILTAGEIAGARAPWPGEPGLDRVAYGVPDHVGRVAALGNAVVPQIPELIGRAILTYERQKEAA